MKSDNKNSFDSYVTRGVLLRNEYGIKEIHDLRSIKSMSFERDQYPNLLGLVKDSKWDQISFLPFGQNDFEFLEIMKFSDQTGKNYVVLVYSNNGLENDPQVIDLFDVTATNDH